jgi:SNF2 family DNA or RNA helicase
MKVWVEENKTIVKCDYLEKEMVKAIGDYKFDKARKVWTFPKKKLVKIIDSLKVEFTPETNSIYEELCEDKKAYQAKLNLATRIKNDELSADEQMDFLMLHKAHHIDTSEFMPHQKKTFMLSILFGSYGLFLDTGIGKTMVAIRLIEYFQKPAMVVAPLYSLEKTWMAEIDKWSGLKRLKTVILWENLKAFKPGNNVYLINYEQFKKLDKQTNGKIHELIETIVIDESQKCKTHDTDITKTILSYREKIPHRFPLTGTPNPNTLLEYWSQMAIVNDELLGNNFYKFRNTYFKPIGFGGFQYVPAAGAKEAIMRQVGMQAISIKKKECISDLPERVFIERIVYMDDTQEVAYDAMQKDNILHFGEHATIAANELVKILKLRQVTAGFTITDQGIPVFISKRKTDALLDLLNEIPADQQVIVFCQFHWEIEELNRLIPNSALLYGGIKAEEKEEFLGEWLAGKKRVLLAHPKSGGTSLNLQQCSYMVWFSLSYSQEEFSQACDRIYRKGQKNACTYFMLLARREKHEKKSDRTVDEVIYDVVVQKQDLMQACMEMLRK